MDNRWQNCYMWVWCFFPIIHAWMISLFWLVHVVHYVRNIHLSLINLLLLLTFFIVAYQYHSDSNSFYTSLHEANPTQQTKTIRIKKSPDTCWTNSIAFCSSRWHIPSTSSTTTDKNSKSNFLLLSKQGNLKYLFNI